MAKLLTGPLRDQQFLLAILTLTPFSPTLAVASCRL